MEKREAWILSGKESNANACLRSTQKHVINTPSRVSLSPMWHRLLAEMTGSSTLSSGAEVKVSSLSLTFASVSLFPSMLWVFFFNLLVKTAKKQHEDG